MAKIRHSGLTLGLTVTYLIWLGLLSVGDWPRLGLFAGLLWMVCLASGHKPLRLVAKSLAVTPFSLAALPLVFTVPGPAWAQLAGHPLSVPGCERFLTILVRAWLGAQAGLLTLSLLGPARVLLALSQLGLPPLFLSIVTLMLRYLEVLSQELTRMNRAREARSSGSNRPSWWWRAGKIGQTAGSLLVRSLERGDRVYLAMKSRGYDGRERRLYVAPGPRSGEWLTFGLAQICMLAMSWKW